MNNSYPACRRANGKGRQIATSGPQKADRLHLDGLYEYSYILATEASKKTAHRHELVRASDSIRPKTITRTIKKTGAPGGNQGTYMDDPAGM
jgi:hypothetical protein